DPDHFLLRVRPEVGVENPAPRKRAGGCDVSSAFHGGAFRGGDNSEPIAEAFPMAADPDLKAPELVACHALDGLGFQNPSAAERALVQEHLEESGIVRSSRNQPGPTGEIACAAVPEAERERKGSNPGGIFADFGDGLGGAWAVDGCQPVTLLGG